uniref:Putative alpha-glucosidase Os06g0675700 n=1 Tax=Anthurium amnicola TaxID=1678845 RepID=A0A1D1XGA4_9ARAE
MESGLALNCTTPASVEASQSIESQPTSHVNVRCPTDPAWEHAQRVGPRSSQRGYCSKVYHGGGIHRIKEHSRKERCRHPCLSKSVCRSSVTNGAFFENL